MLMVIIITGDVENEGRAHQILAYIDEVIEAHPLLELKAKCTVKQRIINDPG